jgi:hypothetical protein
MTQEQEDMKLNMMLAQSKWEVALQQSKSEVHRLREDRNYFRDRYDDLREERPQPRGMKRSRNETRYFNIEKREKLEPGEVEDGYIPLDKY